ncbi:IS110 family transposase [Brevibacillus borstelensis]|jgi:transposase|uniref:IS110 family transposase n=2 Tax=Brevibacillus borstelensis TaxID=45462 RepID=UPI000F096C07|nr:IS110 family transposase [Brevibacillus borstelensis]MED1747158.1 IS110 family transposase [Brevibacillus borstelensis]MED1876404.1 IS110 family transposase [Brevibacillus borstelensis]MED1885916.1 IS110 family transposase [Brevibacillus borstelensis]RNB55123.1 IS110 family transposase [Brevibacillus borstelensis]WNF08138.1 IS110 family transposase [Brevibacillus borstelensis]
MKEDQLMTFSVTQTDGQKEFVRLFYPIYVGVDIGADFHVATCITPEQFRDGKWKRAKTMKFDADSLGISDFLKALQDVQEHLGLKPIDFFVLMEPTGGHYSFLLQQVLLKAGYSLHMVENASVKKFREETLGIQEKSDAIDARTMAYMGWHKSLHPDMKAVRLASPASMSQSIVRTLMRDRWLLTTTLTRRKNQVQQLFQITHPDLKRAFKKLSSPSVLRLALMYPTALDMKGLSEIELREAITKCGAKAIAKKAASELAHVLPNTVALPLVHVVDRQSWLIQEALRIEESLSSIDASIHELLHGNAEKGTPPHPYTNLLFSLPVMSDNWACTLIAVIGDIHRFSTYKEFKKYLGVSAENKQSGTSVKGTRQTFSGVRDTRRVMFQMALILIAQRGGPNVFAAYYERLLARQMPKMKAIGHMSGKVAKIIYSVLKTGVPYDPKRHAAACGVPWNEQYKEKSLDIDIEPFETEAKMLAGISDESVDIEIDEE